jgi:hypothetical protein
MYRIDRMVSNAEIAKIAERSPASNANLRESKFKQDGQDDSKFKIQNSKFKI